MKRVIKKVLLAIAISSIPVLAPFNKVYAIIDTVIIFNDDSVLSTQQQGYGNAGKVLHDGSLNSANISDMDLDMFNADSPTADVSSAVGSFVYSKGDGTTTCIGYQNSTGIDFASTIPHKYTIIKSQNGQEFSLKSIYVDDYSWLNQNVTINNIYLAAYEGNTLIGNVIIDASGGAYQYGSRNIIISDCANGAYFNHVTKLVLYSDASDGGNYIGINGIEVNDPTSYSVATPTSNVDAAGDKIDIKAEDGASIYYTTNGSIPTINNDELYTTPFSISGSCTVKAIAVKNGVRSNILSNDYKKASKIAVSVTDDSVKRGTKVKLQAADANAKIYYTTDGSTPTTSLTPYDTTSDGIAIDATTTINAIAVADGMLKSDVLTKTYTVTGPSAPKASVASGPILMGTEVSLTADDGYTIHYTLDGSTPTTESLIYNGSISIYDEITIKAIAVKGDDISDVATYNYTIQKAANPTSTLLNQTVDKGSKLKLNTATSNGIIYYTLDGTDPKISSTRIKYGGEDIVIEQSSVTIKAFTKCDAMNDSDTVAFTYKVPACSNVVSSIQSGPVLRGTGITFSADPGDIIKYTTDGKDPSESYGQTYNGAVAINSAITLKVIAIDPNDKKFASGVTTYSYSIQKAVDPAANVPTEATLDKGSIIKLSTATPGAKIYYTTDGSDPDPSTSKEYKDGDIAIKDSSLTIKAIAAGANVDSSNIVTFKYYVKTCSLPSVNVSSGDVTKGTVVTLTADAGDTIRYTTDGTTPTETNGYDYTGAITVNKSMRIVAAAFNSKKIQSGNLDESYTVVLHDPVITIKDDAVYVTESDPGSNIYYTLDGSDPTTSSSVYDAAAGIKINGSMTLKVLAVDGSNCKSKIISQTCSQVETPTGDNVDKVAPGGTIYLTGEAGSKIYYTTNGSDPNKSCNLYDPRYGIQIVNPVTVKAIAYKDGKIQSKIFSKFYDVGIEKPEVDVDGNKLTMKDSTPGVEIFYSLDGGKTFNRYDSSKGVILQKASSIQVYAVGYGSKSDTLTENINQAPTPKIVGDSDEVTIGDIIHLTAEPGYDIYYTLDGTTPSKNSTKYDSNTGISVTGATNLSAVAIKTGEIDSQVINRNYKIKIADPTVDIDDDKVTLSDSTPGVMLYYSTDGGKTFNPYDSVAKITVQNATTLNVYAEECGFKSSVVTKNLDQATSLTVDKTSSEVAPGDIIHLIGDAGSDIYYTIDGSNPTKNSIKYDDKIGIKIDKPTTIKAIAFEGGKVNSEIFSKTYGVKIAPVIWSVKDNKIILSCSTPGVDIYYTTDGKASSESSNKYDGKSEIVIDKDCEIKAIAIGYGSSSEVMDKSFIKAQNPVPTVPEGTVGRRKVVYFSFARKGMKIYYTINGDNPTASSMLYDETKGIEVDNSMVIKAIAVTDDMLQSDVITLNYTVGQTPAPISNTPSGEVTGGTDVTLTVPTGAAVYYTTDGSTPTKMSNLYTGPIKINRAMVIKAAAFKDDMLDSDVLSLKYTVLGSENQNSSSGNSAGNTISVQPALDSAAVVTSNNGEGLILTSSDQVSEENNLPYDNTVTAPAAEGNNNTTPTTIEENSKGKKKLSKKTAKDSGTKKESKKEGTLGSIIAKTAAVAAVVGGFIFFIIFKRRKKDEEDGK